METEEPGYIEGPTALGGTVLLCDIQAERSAGSPTGRPRPSPWSVAARTAWRRVRATGSTSRTTGAPCVGSDKGDRLVSRGFESSGYDARIERADLSTGRIERVLDEVGDWKIEAIDDLVFERENGF